MEQVFLVEGEKTVLEVIKSSFEVVEVLATSEFIDRYRELLAELPLVEASTTELKNLGTLASNNAAIAVVGMAEQTALPASGIILASDNINDPGNFGTMLRIADWYGIGGVVASENTTELYNPKVISASKGSFTRIPVFYTNLAEFLASDSRPVLAAVLDGQDVHKFEFPESCILLMGNESHGITPDLEPFVDHRLQIPSYGNAESLNVGVATAVMADNYRRSF